MGPAPCWARASAPLATVPPVSIMSSTRMQGRPSTSPTTAISSILWASRRDRRLYRNARSAWRCSLSRSAVRIRPASGATTTTFSSCSPSSPERKSERMGSAVRWSNGKSKYPCVWPLCRSTETQRYFDFPFDHLTALPILSDFLSGEDGERRQVVEREVEVPLRLAAVQIDRDHTL